MEPKEKQIRENIFQERSSILKKKGYRGFNIVKIKKTFDSLQVTAVDHSGNTVSAKGETKEEAYNKIIKNIDELLDEVSYL